MSIGSLIVIGLICGIITMLIGQRRTSTHSGVAVCYPMSYSDAMDVVNAQVHEYCRRHWDNLVAVGENARGGA